jgi:cytochrome P450
MELVSATADSGGPPRPRAAPIYPGVAEDFDLSNPYLFANDRPFDLFAQLRAKAPVAWRQEGEDSGFWCVTRYEDVRAVALDAKVFSSAMGGILMSLPPPERRHRLLYAAQLNNVVNMDGRDHFQLRLEHIPYFNAGYLARLKTKITHEITRLLDAMALEESCDFVESFSSKLPLFTICELLGVPVEDRAKFEHWLHYLEMSLAHSSGIESSEEARKAMAGFDDTVAEMFEYGRDMLRKRRADPQPDLLTGIANAKVDGELLPVEYLDGSWLTVVFGGNDTTRNTMSGSVKLLSEFPDQRAKLLARPELRFNAVQEFLRMVTPFTYVRRTATCDVELGGQKISRGEKVIIYFASANRDETVFPDPDRLDIERANASKQIAFGTGTHVCLGQRVAQMQLEMMHEQLLPYFPDIHYEGGIQIAPNNFAFCIQKLPVSLRKH